MGNDSEIGLTPRTKKYLEGRERRVASHEPKGGRDREHGLTGRKRKSGEVQLAPLNRPGDVLSLEDEQRRRYMERVAQIGQQ